MVKKEYAIRKLLTDEEKNKFIGFSPILTYLMFHRGIEADEANLFLNPDFDKNLNDPYLLHGMEKTVDRIIKAIKSEEKIVIYSDYDADGLSAATVFYDFFDKIGYKNFLNYIPNRNEEGFGLHKEALEKLVKDGAGLIITLDCGIGDLEEAKFAKELGVDLIITDHHLPKENLPQAYAIVNPKISKKDELEYPEKMLCGAAVTWKVVCAILARERFGAPEGFEKWLLDVVGMATLSDMVPLRGENRLLAKYGMIVLRKTRRIGLIKLLRMLKIDPRNLTEDDVGFMITPRINAASRMGRSVDALRLLTTKDENEAAEIVATLEKVNQERKTITAHLSKEVKKMVEAKYSPYFSNKVIVAGSPAWKLSLLGIVAGTMVETEMKPVFLWGKEEMVGLIKGSCRAPEGVSLTAIMEKVPPGILTEFGGHHMAGGFSVSYETIHLLEDEIAKAYEIEAKEFQGSAIIWIDKELELEEANLKNFSEIEKLSPFGIANEKPVFVFKNCFFEKVDFFGKEKKHLKIILTGGKGFSIESIAFFATEDLISKAEVGAKKDIVGNLEKSFFGRPKARIRVIDILN